MPELDRRDFLKIVGLSAGAAAAAGCSDPVERVIPYLNHPEEIIPGIPTYYASTCRECPSACAITVKTREGRPIKVDGNAADPASQGALCIRGQASLARTYDPSRFRGPQKREGDALVPTTWDDALGILAEKARAASSGKMFFLGGSETGTLGALVDEFLASAGSGANRLRYEVFAHEALRAANGVLFGRASVPHFAFDRADLVISFGADFLETWLETVPNGAGFAASRKGGEGYAVYVGPRLGLTGSNCDEWIAPKPGTEIFVAAALAREVAQKRGVAIGGLDRFTLDAAATATGVAKAKLEKLAKRAAEAGALLALPPGNELQGSNATAFAAAVQLLNHAAGSIGKTVVFGPDHAAVETGGYADLSALAKKLGDGGVDVLLVHGGVNPVYSAPGLGFADAMKKAFVVSFASASDETTALADLVLPDHTAYEAWGDAEPVRGVRRLQQPTIRPLFDTRATGDVLVDLAGKLGLAISGTGTMRDRIAARWGGSLDAPLASGGIFEPAAAEAVTLQGTGDLRFEEAKLSGAGLALVVYPSNNLYDGRSARIGMLQEVPDPVMKRVWGSFAELHPETASELGIGEGDIVRVKTANGALELPAIPHDAIAKGVVAIAVGQGHQPVDPGVPDPDRQKRRQTIGVNAFELLGGESDASGALPWLGARAEVEKIADWTPLAKPQATFDQEGRGVAQAISLAALANGEQSIEHGEDHGGGHGGGHGDDHHMPPYADALHLETEEFDPTDPENPTRYPTYRWGMSIDLDACSGCGACVVACQTENNIPVIGEEMVRKGREMHWLRIERYVEEHDGEIEVRHTPMLCQHCGSAPCESVCPVFATYNNNEGLNVMVPNRCIGTRYCGNNCPYKVRRFNYFSYDWDLLEPEELALNPDVMVRSKGVMEKCTFCVQRINGAKDQARREGREVREGEVTPACAQTCPTKAISFGNHKNPDSQVAQDHRDRRAYWVLHHLNTRPGVTYLKKIQRKSKEA